MKLKGFYKHMPLQGGDDDLFVNRASSEDNIAVCLTADSFTFSNPKTTWYDWYRQKTRHLAIGVHYKSAHKWILGMLGLSNILFYFSLIPLLFFKEAWMVAGLGLFLKMANQTFVMYRVKQNLNESISVWMFPVLDFVHSIVIFAFLFPARFSRRATWM